MVHKDCAIIVRAQLGTCDNVGGSQANTAEKSSRKRTVIINAVRSHALDSRDERVVPSRGGSQE